MNYIKNKFNRRLILKKYFKYLSLFFVLIFGFNFQINQANAYYACSPGQSQCADAILSYGGDSTVFSSEIFISKGQSIKYEWENDSPGIFHVAFYVVKDNQKMSPTLYAVAKGNDFGYFVASESGYYSLYALCKGGDDNRCRGGGTISKF